MRRILLSIAGVTLAVPALGLPRVSAQQAKPTQVGFVHTEFKAPPDTLREMVLEADAVVYGRILEGVSKDVGWYRKTEPGITTFYRFRVSDVLRLPGDRYLDTSELTVVRDGGAIDRGDRIEKLEVDDFPQFEIGREYVLFLRWNAEHEAWTPDWGPHGTFEVNAGQVHSVGSAKICREHDGLTIATFVAKLRK